MSRKTCISAPRRGRRSLQLHDRDAAFALAVQRRGGSTSPPCRVRCCWMPARSTPVPLPWTTVSLVEGAQVRVVQIFVHDHHRIVQVLAPDIHHGPPCGLLPRRRPRRPAGRRLGPGLLHPDQVRDLGGHLHDARLHCTSPLPSGAVSTVPVWSASPASPARRAEGSSAARREAPAGPPSPPAVPAFAGGRPGSFGWPGSHLRVRLVGGGFQLRDERLALRFRLVQRALSTAPAPPSHLLHGPPPPVSGALDLVLRVLFGPPCAWLPPRALRSPVGLRRRAARPPPSGWRPQAARPPRDRLSSETSVDEVEIRPGAERFRSQTRSTCRACR